MNSFHNTKGKQSAFSMIEVLITLVILLVGLLGLAGLHIQAQRSEVESYQRVQALILLDDMVERINANRQVASCYAYTNDASGTPYLGNGAGAIPACAAGTLAQQTRANQDLTDWSDLLKGAAETSGSSVGAMIGARGCVSLIATNTYRISVSWQGLADTVDPSTLVPSLTCATGAYGSLASRRVVSLPVRFGCLHCD